MKDLSYWCSRQTTKILQIEGWSYIGIENLKTIQNDENKTISIIWERPLKYDGSSAITMELMENQTYNVYLSYGIFTSIID
jgi:hypothetical protein